MARLRTGRPVPVSASVQTHLLVHLETHGWLLDYYQVHIDLVDLHLATLAADAPAATRLHQRVAQYAAIHRAPFFRRVAERVAWFEAGATAAPATA